MYSFLSKEMKNPYKKEVIINNYKKILIAMTPVIPHFANECLENLKLKGNFIWPKFDLKLTTDEEITFVIGITISV